MRQPYLSAVLTIGVLLAGALVAASISRQHWPDNHQGYAPSQPIAFSHRLHAGQLGMDCRFCHSAANESRHAGIPSADTCMRCHKFVTAPFDQVRAEMRLADKQGREPRQIISDELQKLYDATAVDEQMRPIEGKEPQAIPWVRVHDLPDYVYFDHRAHVNAGVSCQQCHGPVESMHRVQQFSSLSMGWCVDCHRDTAKNGVAGRPVSPSLDCSACHY